MFDQNLLNEVINSGPVFWAGKQAPVADFTVSTRIVDPDFDFREAASRHGKFSAVYLLEYDLGRIKQWPLIVDEALRLLKHGATSTLFVRFTQSQFLSIFGFAAFLRRRRDFTITLEFQEFDPDGTFVYALRCKRLSVQPTLSTIEFALITDGRRPDKVKRFVDSIAAVRGIDRIAWSVAICGPLAFGETLETLNGEVRFIKEPDQHTSKGWITRKKNLIVETSNAENLLIAHDRYEVPVDFLEQMFEFGADFSVLSPAQFDLQGKRFPDWVTLGSQWAWSIAGMLEYGDYSPHIYINGGVIISKREVLLETPWSDLLFWSQGEDVELTRSMAEKGVTPRLARNVRLRVTDARPGYTYEFARLPFRNDRYVLPGGCSDASEAPGSLMAVNAQVRLADRSPQDLASEGIFIAPGQWGLSAAGIVTLQDGAEFTMDTGAPLGHALFILMETAAAPAQEMTIRINGEVAAWKAEQYADAEGSRIAVSVDETLSQKVRMLTVSLDGSGPLPLTSLGLSMSDRKLDYPVHFGFDFPESLQAHLYGWSNPEPWGIWSVGDKAALRLPLNKVGGGIRLAITAIGFTPKNMPRQTVGIACNGVPLGLFNLEPSGKPGEILVDIEKVVLQRNEEIILEFVPVTTSSPHDQGMSVDQRQLGLGLMSIHASPLPQ
jgi:hypothetical protein